MAPSELPNQVPEDILALSVDGRVAYFGNRFVAHQAIVDARDQIMRFIYTGQRTIAMIFGPTGAGKTTARKITNRGLTKDFLDHPDKWHGRIPSAGVALDLGTTGKFNWRNDYYIPALKSLSEPLIDQKVNYDLETIVDQNTGRPVIHRQMREADYREALRKTLNYRDPGAFWVDDAQLLTVVSRGGKLRDQMVSIKGLAEGLDGSPKRTPHLLFGNYDMLNLVGLSGELMRRTVHIHLPRYDGNVYKNYRGKLIDGRQEFVNTLAAFQMMLPVRVQPDLLPYSEYFFYQTQGCIGILKDCLTAALDKALREGKETIEPKHWEEFELPIWEIEALGDMIREGEQRMANITGNVKPSVPTPPATPDPTKSSKSKNSRPGTRKPGHDPVGIK